MMNENNELILEIWARIKSYLPPKTRLEVADTLVVVFDEFGIIDESILDEDLDKEMRAAARSHLPVDEEDDINEDDSGYGF